MSVISRIIGLRLVGTTKYITKQNTTKYLQSMCQVRNRCSHTTKNPITPAQKKSAEYWKTIKICTMPLTIIGMNIAIYCAYKIKTDPEFWDDVDMWIAAWEETLKYSITPSKIITSSVLFDDSKMEIFVGDDYQEFENDNTRNLILSEELDANIQEPFPRSEPVPIKIDRFNGLLDNGKLTLTTVDGDATFTFHHTLILEVKKTSTTLQDEIAAMKIEPSEIVQKKISKFHVYLPDHKVTLKTSKGENNYHLIHNVTLECDKKVDENLQNIIATEEPYPEDMIFEVTNVLFDCGTVVFKTQDGRKLLQNGNSRNLILSKELDANIQEPFPRGEPVPIKTGGVNGLLDNGKLTLKDGNRTLPTTTVDHSDPVKDASRTFSSFKLSGTFLATGNFSYSVEETVKIQADESDEVYHFKHNVKLECDKKVDENLQNMIATKEVSPDDIVDKGTNVTVNCGTVVFKTQDGRKIFYFKQNVNFEYDRKLDENSQNIIVTKILSREDLVSQSTCVEFDSGAVVFKTQDGKKIIVRQKCEIILLKDVKKIDLYAKPYLTLDYV
ncbi:hypothetical protein HCN44_007977 [Aphidius gifuensis]|uniref:Uncharacterized protein n=1 Tax=Aphidius gifuensis TaxID=684658 RepID=A0A834XMW9_APHGI|nr:hypothetical protein HCN44_007977 [Aphidius gifuensis]